MRASIFVLSVVYAVAYAAPAGQLFNRASTEDAVAYPDTYKRNPSEDAIAYPDSYKREASKDAIAYPDSYKRNAAEDAIAYPDSYKERREAAEDAVAYPNSYKRSSEEKREAAEDAIAYPDSYKRAVSENAIAYPDSYELHINFVGGKVKYIPLHPPPNASAEVHSANDWTFDVGELERAISRRTKMLILNTPHNPLGKIFSTRELHTIGSFCTKHNILILSDEVYERLYFTSGSPFPRIATLSPAFFRNTITIGSVGKSFEATGWRIGYAIGHADLIRYMQAAHVVLAFTTAGPAQLAAARGLKAAEENGFWEERRWGMQAKLESLCEVFRELELPYVQPAGAHYVMLNAGKLRIPADYIFPEKVDGKSRDWKLCWFVLQEAGVATIPVSASFSKPGAHVGDEYLRTLLRHRQASKDHGCQQPPSITQHDPIFGFDLMIRLHRALKRNHRNKSIVQLFSSHGPTFCAPSSTSTKLYTIEPKNLQTIFSTDASSWGVGPMRRFAFEPFVGKGIMCVDGKDWEHSRTLIKPTFARAQSTDQHLEDFEKHMDRLIDLIPQDGSMVDLQPLFSRLALDASTEFLFGEALGTLKENGLSNESDDFLQAYNYGQYVLGKRLHLPKWNFLTVDKRFRRSCRVAHAFVDERIARAQLALRDYQGRDKVRERYILARDLVSQTIDAEDARNQLLNIFLPAHEAVGVALTNTFFNLARNPEVFTKLRQEVLKAGAEDRPWTFERLKGIKYLQYVINESFRLNPSIGTNTRMALKDTILPTGGGLLGTSPMYVRQGDVATTSFYALHRRKDVFGEDADIFKPERWESLRPPPWSFLPFGGGPRVCPGQNLALTEISYALVRIVEAFEKIENRDPVTEFIEVYKITTDSGNGAKVALFAEHE
ncbi:MAG: hypothetical protein Q9165_008551 [Trypethelium subeluteriae]